MIDQGVYAMARKRVNTRGYASWLSARDYPSTLVIRSTT